MKPTVIDWDGSRMPQELRDLPPGRHVLEPIDERPALIPDERPALTPEEESGILAALDQLDAGRGVPILDVVREIRAATRTR